MMFLYSGTPGSGKSLHSAKVIYESCFKNLPIICNFEIDRSKVRKKLFMNCKTDSFYYVDNTDLTPQYLKEFSRNYFNNKRVREGTITLIIDEAQIIFNARSWNAKGRDDWIHFFTHHRKFGYDIILVAQFDRMLDRQIRSLIEYEVIHRKISNFGWRGKLVSALFLGKMFMGVRVWYPLKEKVGNEVFPARKKYYTLYDTFNVFESSDTEGAE